VVSPVNNKPVGVNFSRAQHFLAAVFANKRERLTLFSILAFILAYCVTSVSKSGFVSNFRTAVLLWSHKNSNSIVKFIPSPFFFKIVRLLI